MFHDCAWGYGSPAQAGWNLKIPRSEGHLTIAPAVEVDRPAVETQIRLLNDAN